LHTLITLINVEINPINFHRQIIILAQLMIMNLKFLRAVHILIWIFL